MPMSLHQKAGQRGRIFDRGRQADAAQIGAQGVKAGKQEGELVAAFALGQGVNFVDHNALQMGENPWCIGVTEQQGKAFGCGQQDMRRVGALAAALGLGGVARAILDPDGKARALDGAA